MEEGEHLNRSNEYIGVPKNSELLTRKAISDKLENILFKSKICMQKYHNNMDDIEVAIRSHCQEIRDALDQREEELLLQIESTRKRVDEEFRHNLNFISSQQDLFRNQPKHESGIPWQEIDTKMAPPTPLIFDGNVTDILNGIFGWGQIVVDPADNLEYSHTSVFSSSSPTPKNNISSSPDDQNNSNGIYKTQRQGSSSSVDFDENYENPNPDILENPADVISTVVLVDKHSSVSIVSLKEEIEDEELEMNPEELPPPPLSLPTPPPLPSELDDKYNMYFSSKQKSFFPKENSEEDSVIDNPPPPLFTPTFIPPLPLVLPATPPPAPFAPAIAPAPTPHPHLPVTAIENLHVVHSIHLFGPVRSLLVTPGALLAAVTCPTEEDQKRPQR
jgi:hypothetical protein